jgi:hypothetical protein
MNIKLDLHIETVNACLAGLGKLPYEAVAQHINIIHQQATPQVQAAEQAAKEKQVVPEQPELPLAQPE